MAITILHEIIRKSFKLFADILTPHDVSGPSEYELLNTIINKKLESPRLAEYPQVKLYYSDRPSIVIIIEIILRSPF